MTWFKIDDGFWSHPKTMALSAESVALWTRAGSYSCQHLTDGFIGEAVIRLVGDLNAAAELTAAGLWVKVDGGWSFHDWGEYQETAEAVKKRQANARERQRHARAMREQKRHESQMQSQGKSRVTGAVTDGVSAQEVFNPRPGPTRPDLSTSNEVDEGGAKRARARGTRLPDGWMPDQPVIDSMKLECPAVDLQAEHRKFVDYWQAKTGKDATKLDWNATWRNWIRRATPSTNTHHDPTRSGWDDLKTATSHQLGA